MSNMLYLLSSALPFKELVSFLKIAIKEYEDNPTPKTQTIVEGFALMITLHTKNGDNPSPEAVIEDLKVLDELTSNPLEKEPNKN